MSKYDFRDVKLENKNGTMAIGEHQTINNVVNKGLGEVSESFKDEILKSNLSQNEKDEIQGAISAAEKEAESKKPNKMVLTAVLDSIQKTINVAKATPQLITAFDKWKDFFNQFLN